MAAGHWRTSLWSPQMISSWFLGPGLLGPTRMHTAKERNMRIADLNMQQVHNVFALCGVCIPHDIIPFLLKVTKTCTMTQAVQALASSLRASGTKHLPMLVPWLGDVQQSLSHWWSALCFKWAACVFTRSQSNVAVWFFVCPWFITFCFHIWACWGATYRSSFCQRFEPSIQRQLCEIAAGTAFYDDMFDTFGWVGLLADSRWPIRCSRVFFVHVIIYVVLHVLSFQCMAIAKSIFVQPRRAVEAIPNPHCTNVCLVALVCSYHSVRVVKVS